MWIGCCWESALCFRKLGTERRNIKWNCYFRSCAAISWIVAKTKTAFFFLSFFLSDFVSLQVCTIVYALRSYKKWKLRRDVVIPSALPTPQALPAFAPDPFTYIDLCRKYRGKRSCDTIDKHRPSTMPLTLARDSSRFLSRQSGQDSSVSITDEVINSKLRYEKQDQEKKILRKNKIKKKKNLVKEEGKKRYDRANKDNAEHGSSEVGNSLPSAGEAKCSGSRSKPKLKLMLLFILLPVLFF